MHFCFSCNDFLRLCVPCVPRKEICGSKLLIILGGPPGRTQGDPVLIQNRPRSTTDFYLKKTKEVTLRAKRGSLASFLQAS